MGSSDVYWGEESGDGPHGRRIQRPGEGQRACGHTNDYRPVGDIDGTGASLAVALKGYPGGLEIKNEDETKVVRCSGVTWDGQDLKVMLQHGQSGVAADINDP